MEDDGKALIIGVVVPSITNLYFPLVVSGIQEYLHSFGFKIMLCYSNGSALQEMSNCKEMVKQKVDGIICIDPQAENSSFYELLSRIMPVVLVNGFYNGVRCNFVLNEQSLGAELALNYLFELGHKKIALLKGKNSFSYDVKEVEYLKFIKRHSLEPMVYEISSGNTIHTTNMAKWEVSKRLKEENSPTAIFACNDWMAVGALNAAKTLNINVPQEISIIGFDNILISEITEPALTTVDQNMHNAGVQAAQMIYKLNKQLSETFLTVHVENTLVIRDSCGAAQ